jgi:uncharacterized membrane protein
MTYKEESVEVDVPVRTAYNQWTQFEDFPKFMDAVEEVVQQDDKRLLWKVKIGGKPLQWSSEISDQTPDERIAWRSTSGPQHGGAVLFTPLDADRTRVTVKIQYEPEGLAENVASALGLVSGRIEHDLEHFKEFIEARGVESGAWRGEIHGEKVTR